MMDCFGFTALIVIAILFFGVISSLRRRQRERLEEMMYRQHAPPPITRLSNGVCPRCNAANVAEASFCRQCGLNIRQLNPPAPPPHRRQDYRRASPTLLYLIFGLIGLIGVATWLFSSTKPAKEWHDDDDRGKKSYRSYER